MAVKKRHRLELKRRRCAGGLSWSAKLVGEPASGKGIMSNLLGFTQLVCNANEPSVLNQNLFSSSFILPSISSHYLFPPSKQSNSLTPNSRTSKRRATSHTVLSNFRASKQYFSTLHLTYFLILSVFFGNFCFLGGCF